MTAHPSRLHLPDRKARIRRALSLAVGLIVIALILVPGACTHPIGAYLSRIGVTVTGESVLSPDRPSSASTASASGVTPPVQDSVTAGDTVDPGYRPPPHDGKALARPDPCKRRPSAGIAGTTPFVGPVIPRTVRMICRDSCRPCVLADRVARMSNVTSSPLIAGIETTDRDIVMDVPLEWASPLVQGVIMEASNAVDASTAGPLGNGWETVKANEGATPASEAPTRLAGTTGTSSVDPGLVSDYRFDVIGPYTPYPPTVLPPTVLPPTVLPPTSGLIDGTGTPQPVPLPPSIALLAIGVLAMIPTIRRRVRQPDA